MPFSRISTLLITPAIPLAPSRWPMFALIDPTYNGSAWLRYCPKAAPIAQASIGSKKLTRVDPSQKDQVNEPPTGVPVP
jgi:hypothetical protein